VRDISSHPRWYRVIISLPTSETVTERTWTTEVWPMDDAQVTDMLHWVLLTIYNAVAVSSGVQGAPFPDELLEASAGLRDG